MRRSLPDSFRSSELALSRGASADALRGAVLVQLLLGVDVLRFQVEGDLLHRSGERVGRLVLVGLVYDETVVPADIHARVRGERDGHASVDPAFADLLVARVERDRASRARLGFIGIEPHGGDVLTGGKRLVGHALEDLDAQHRVRVRKPAVAVHPQREPTHLVRVGHEHAFGAALGHRDIGFNRVAASVDARDHAALDVLHVAVELETGNGRQRRQDPEEDRHAAQKRQGLVAVGLGPEQLLQLGELLGLLGGEVVRLGEVIGEVVELPSVVLGVVDTRRELLDGRR